LNALDRVGNLEPQTTTLRNFGFALAAVILAFAKPLFDLVQFALSSDTFSHVLLVPFISAYLASLRRKSAVLNPAPASSGMFVALSVGVVLLVTWLIVSSPDLRLCLSTLAFVCFVFAAAFRFLGTAAAREFAFPLGFLFLMAPLPTVIMDPLELFFQHASAWAAAVMMKVSGLPALREGLFFLLPGLRIEVAQECSGIRSTLVLFITSLIAGHLLLRNPLHRAILAASIVPIAILRNGFRIFSLAWLSVEVNPDIIDSPLHHQGGPIYFALALIPLVLLLLVLRRLEKKPRHAS
jgi:exosortase C (VPDSG-CTERM-specific)